MARRALKAIDWAAIAERIPENQKGILAAFKAKSDLFLRKVQEYPESAPKIDWALYKKTISVPGMVDQFQKQYESLSIPYPADNFSSIVDAQEKESLSLVEQFIKEANEQIAKSNAEINKIQAMLPFSEMTMEDFKDAYPDMALDAINTPTIYPHDPNNQPGSEEKEQPSH